MSSPGCQRPVLAHISLVKDHTVLASRPNHKTRNRIKPFDGFERTHEKRVSVLESRVETLMTLDPSRSSSMIANNSNIDSIVELLEVDFNRCENNGLLPLTLRVPGSPQSEPGSWTTRRATKQEITTTGQQSNAHYMYLEIIFMI